MPWTGGSYFRSEHVTRLVRQRMLGSDAIYRVGRRSGELVEVEVVAAPALASGTRLLLTAGSLGAMARPVVAAHPARLAARAAAFLSRRESRGPLARRVSTLHAGSRYTLLAVAANTSSRTSASSAARHVSTSVS